MKLAQISLGIILAVTLYGCNDGTDVCTNPSLLPAGQNSGIPTEFGNHYIFAQRQGEYIIAGGGSIIQIFEWHSGILSQGKVKHTVNGTITGLAAAGQDSIDILVTYRGQPDDPVEAEEIQLFSFTNGSIKQISEASASLGAKIFPVSPTQLAMIIPVTGNQNGHALAIINGGFTPPFETYLYISGQTHRNIIRDAQLGPERFLMLGSMDYSGNATTDEALTLFIHERKKNEQLQIRVNPQKCAAGNEPCAAEPVKGVRGHKIMVTDDGRRIIFAWEDSREPKLRFSQVTQNPDGTWPITAVPIAVNMSAQENAPERFGTNSAVTISAAGEIRIAHLNGTKTRVRYSTIFQPENSEDWNLSFFLREVPAPAQLTDLKIVDLGDYSVLFVSGMAETRAYAFQHWSRCP